MISQSLLKRHAPLAVIGLAIILFFAFDLGQYLNLQAVQEHKDMLKNTVEQHLLLSLIGFSLAYIMAVALSLPIATILTLLSGFLFGFTLGAFVVIISATIGASLIFLIAKSSFGDVLKTKAGPYYERAAKEFEENALQYLFFLRLAPIFPFAVVNILPAFFNMPLRKYIIATFFGIIPGSAVYVYTGQSLGQIDNLSDIISSDILLAFALLGSLALLPVIIKKIRKRPMNHGTDITE